MADDMRAKAMELLEAMYEHRVNVGGKVDGEELVNPYEVTHYVGLDPGTHPYNDAVNYLVDKGAIEWASVQVGDSTFYKVTRRGLEMLGH